MPDSQLTPNEHQLLAREVVANRFYVGEDTIELTCEECGCRDTYSDLIAPSVARDAVKFGWDAAMEYMKGQSDAEVEKWRRYAKDLEHDMEASEKHCAEFHS